MSQQTANDCSNFSSHMNYIQSTSYFTHIKRIDQIFQDHREKLLWCKNQNLSLSSTEL